MSESDAYRDMYHRERLEDHRKLSEVELRVAQLRELKELRAIENANGSMYARWAAVRNRISELETILFGAER